MSEEVKQKKYPLYMLVAGVRTQAIQTLFTSLSHDKKDGKEHMFKIFRWYQQVREATEAFDSIQQQIREQVQNGDKDRATADRQLNELGQTDISIGPVPDPVPLSTLEKGSTAFTLQQLEMLELLGLIIQDERDERDSNVVEGEGKTVKDLLQSKMEELEGK